MQVRARHPRLGGLILALGAEPSSATAWAKGAEGERIVASRLDQVEGVLKLHDRRIPGGRANIDHIVVGPAGVYVIDAKHYRGQVARRDVGGVLRRDERLFVGRRDCTKLIDAMTRQVEAVRLALGNPDVAVHAALCFVDADWPLFARPFSIDCVWVGWPKALVQHVTRVGQLDAPVIQRVATRLAASLPPA